MKATGIPHARRRAAGTILLSATAGALVASALWLAATRLGGPGVSEADLHPLGGLRVAVESRPAVPKVGDNILRVRVLDAAGKAARDARVSALVFMPQMGSMPYMESRPPMREVRPGLYEGRFTLVMGGSWDVDLAVASAGGAGGRAALRLTVGTEGFTWVSEEEPAAAPADSAAAGEPVPGTVTLSPRRRQEIGVVTDTLRVRDLDYERQAAGKVTYDETRRSDVTLKFQGWVRELRADFTGQPVRRGETLFTVYSPELYAAEREFVAALAARDSAADGAPRRRAAELAAAARRRLLLWDLPAAHVDRLERTRQPSETVPVVSPVSGVILEKSVVQGSSVTPGQALFRIAPLDPLWVVADVFQYELPYLERGDPVRVAVPGEPGADRTGRVSFVYPYLRDATRTGQVRLEVANRDLALKPDMYVEVTVRVPLGRRLAVPASAVVYGGERRIVFVDRGGGRLEPREVELGPRAGDYYAVTAGLASGEAVVTSGNFLVAAESRLRSTLENW